MKKFVELCVGRAWLLMRWLFLAGVTGAVLGVLGGLFGKSITLVTAFRGSHPWMLYLLPLSGLLIVAMYRMDPYKTGTNRVLEGIQSDRFIPLRTAPLIVASTVITHTFGASAGREGAALQLGGSIGGTFGKWLKMDDYDHRIMIMCGMSAGFSALFGTPLTATVFAMEVASVGMMQYAALVPCCAAALIAKEIALFLGVHGEHFALPAVTVFDWKSGGLIILLAVCCAGISILFCMVLHFTEHLYKKWIPNEYLRIAAGGCLVILMTVLLGTTDYLGAGMDVIERSMEGQVIAAAFLLKMVFTAVSLGSGYRGGEIVPTLFVGATFGCLFGQLTGLPPSLGAACGMASVFCGVTNCPVSSLFLSFELFGFECMPFFLLSVSISYLESGYYGLYHSQKILYSKTKLQFIDAQTKE